MITVFTNGCFDIIHRGHLELFAYAKSLGDRLVVGVDSDKKVKMDKGHERPINGLVDRMIMLSSLRYIDEVYSFDTPEGLADLVREISPSIMVVGSDWKGKSIVGSQFADEVKYFDRLEKYSTTKIIEGLIDR